MVEVVGEIDGRERGGQVRQYARQTQVEGVLRDFSKREGFLNDFLYVRLR